MLKRFQRVCIYVPRRCRSVIAICCTVLCVSLVVVAMHASAMAMGVIAGAQGTTEQMLRDSIPRAAEKRSGLELQMSKNAAPHSSLSVRALGNLTCPKQSASVLFFIRIPKAASTSFVHLLKDMELSGQFKLMFQPSGASDWDLTVTKKVAETVKRASKKGIGKLIYARHFYYVDFNTFGLHNFAYITILRHPVNRLISSYLYYHFSSKQHIQEILNPSHKNDSLETCVRLQHNGCVSNLMTKYFCGHENFCKEGSSRALEQAQRNMERDFAAVGIMEEMDLSLQVFRETLPDYFQQLGSDKFSIPVFNKNERSLNISHELELAITSANEADMIIYEHAKELLYQRAHQCGISTS